MYYAQAICQKFGKEKKFSAQATVINYEHSTSLGHGVSLAYPNLQPDVKSIPLLDLARRVAVSPISSNNHPTIILLALACFLSLYFGGMAATSASEEDATFSKYQRQALDVEHQGNKAKALSIIDTALKELKSLPPYSDKISQLRVRRAELLIQNKRIADGMNAVRNIIADQQKIVPNISDDGDFWLEVGYLKDLLIKCAEENDSQDAAELAHQVCLNFKQIRCKPRDTLEPLCTFYIKHKQWPSLETSAKELLVLSNDPLSQMSSLAMLKLSYEKQGRKKDAAAANQKLNALDVKTPENERVWHRDMAFVQKTVLDYDQALKEINEAINSDEKLRGTDKMIQQATDLGIKADIENKLGRYSLAVQDAKKADQLWTQCNPNIWRSHSAILYAKCHGDGLAALELALRNSHRTAEADSIRAHRREIEYVR